MGVFIVILILAIILGSWFFSLAEQNKEAQRKDKEKYDRLSREIEESKRGYVIEEGMLVWKEQEKIDPIVALADIVILAEVTTDQGPFRDDYFFVVVDRHQDARWLPTQLLSQNTLEALLSHLNGEWTGSLASCTDWNSRIMAPSELSGEPLYDWKAYKRSEYPFTQQVANYCTRISGAPVPV